jgi:hypothetical protein
MGVYAPTDPHNFAVVNNFFRGGIYTGAVTQTAGNVETVTTPFVQSLYFMRPPVGVADLNSINYKPAIPSASIMFASPFVNIYGPHGELLSGSRDDAVLGLLGPGPGPGPGLLGQTIIPQLNVPFPQALVQVAQAAQASQATQTAQAAQAAQAGRWPSFALSPSAIGYPFGYYPFGYPTFGYPFGYPSFGYPFGHPFPGLSGYGYRFAPLPVPFLL